MSGDLSLQYLCLYFSKFRPEKEMIQKSASETKISKTEIQSRACIYHSIKSHWRVIDSNNLYINALQSHLDKNPANLGKS
jgi:hypothetical protein